MNNYHLFSIRQLDKYVVLRLIQKANEMKYNHLIYNLQGKILINYFCEPSTRTSCSFQTAMYKLGGQVITINDQTSSRQKGESLEDTIKTLGNYGDVIVMRHPEKGSVERATLVSSVSIINAGDGSGEHPTQALLDIYTIYTELTKRGIHINSDRRFPSLIITFVGDLKNSRTIHSLVYLLCYFPCIRFNYVCPEGLEMPEDICAVVEGKGIQQEYKSSLEETLSTTDIFYVTRIQKERFNTEAEYLLVKQYSITMKEVSVMKETAIIMHPLPRLMEISTDIDKDPRAVYFNQVENGVYMRMAILHDILNSSVL